MTREEAIEVLQKNYPDSCYTMLREAVDMAIEALQDLLKPNNRSQGSDDNMTGITEGSYTGFCKSQLITCNRVKECNGVCPFEDALKHADQTQTMNEQHIINHDRDWIIGCIQHDGFIHTHRFDKANQIILEALSADRPTVDKEYLIDLIQEAVYDGEACKSLLDLIDEPTGHWITDIYKRGTERHVCSNCGKGHSKDSHYCPNCGARML